jgi:hypothetical protein
MLKLDMETEEMILEWPQMTDLIQQKENPSEKRRQK